MQLPSLPLPALPRPMLRLAAALPAWPLATPASQAFVAAANLAAWPALRELDWSQAHGRHFCVQVRDFGFNSGLKLHFTLHERGFRAERSGPADVTFSASAADFARLALRLEDPDTLFFNRRLLSEGDTDLGLGIKNMLDAVELEAAAARMPGMLGHIVLRLRQFAVER
jgi:O2-independent ubiquinone biosynthesis accessory factor UbiT